MYNVNNTMFNFFGPKVPQVTVEEVKNAIDAKENVVLLDVRTTGEYAQGKIKNSLNIPLDQVGKSVEKHIPNKEKKIYVYCLSGARSSSAVGIMIGLGYTNVSTMASGMLAWRAKGYPVV
jgi:rhodanese-related sulfurtransferase